MNALIKCLSFINHILTKSRYHGNQLITTIITMIQRKFFDNPNGVLTKNLILPFSYTLIVVECIRESLDKQSHVVEIRGGKRITIKHKTAISYNVISNKNGLKWQSFSDSKNLLGMKINATNH